MALPLSQRPYITGAIFLIIGLVLAIGGIWLVGLGGSPYYLIAGAASPRPESCCFLATSSRSGSTGWCFSAL
ncbi:hypothetical protein [Sphingomonas oryzagri]